MVFSSMVFLCLYLPVVCLVYMLIPIKMRNLWLLFASLCFYAYGEPVYIWIMIWSTVFDYCNGRMLAFFIQKGKKHTAGRVVLWVSILGNLSVLGFFKYWDFFVTNVNQMAGTQFPVLSLALPIGISFYTFQTMSYTIDVYREEIKPQKNIWDFGMYVCLFPQLIAGPIVRYAQIEKEMHNRKLSLQHMYEGLFRFSIGLGKKVLLANQFGEIHTRVSQYTGKDQTMASLWLAAVAFTLQIYYDFSGYSDMAIGLGRCFGFTFPENFQYPYVASSVTDFWRRWHKTLSGWFRSYLYISLGGNRKGILRQILNLLIVWFLTGLWHGAGWNFILWGLYYFVLLTIEKCIFYLVKQQGKSQKNKNTLQETDAEVESNGVSQQNSNTLETKLLETDAEVESNGVSQQNSNTLETKLLETGAEVENNGASQQNSNILERKLLETGAEVQGQGKKRNWFVTGLLGLGQHGYTLLAIVFGWVLFSQEQVEKLGVVLAGMIGIGVKIGNTLALYDWNQAKILLLLGAVGATGFPKQISQKVVLDSAKEILQPLFAFLLLFLSMAYIVSGSYNPFLYFRF